MNEEERQSFLTETMRPEAEKQQWRLNFFDENVSNAKSGFWTALAGWCGYYLFQWLADFTNYEFFKGAFPQGIFFLFGIFGTPVFLWYFIPVSVLKLPTRFQFAGQVVAASFAAFLPLAVLIFVFPGPSFIVTPQIVSFKDHYLITIFLGFLLIYLLRTIGYFPWMFPPPIRQIFCIRLYLIASGISFIISFGPSQPHRGIFYLSFLALSYLGITIGYIEKHFGIAQRREARAWERRFDKAMKEVEKERTRKKKVEASPKDSSQKVTSQDLTDEVSRESEENWTIKNEYAAFLQRKEGSWGFYSEEDLPYSKEKIKKALLMVAASIQFYLGQERVPDQVVNEQLTAYRTAFLALANFIPKEEALNWQKVDSLVKKTLEKRQKKEPVAPEESKYLAEEYLKFDIEKFAKELEESQKKLEIEWDIEMKKHVSLVATAKRLAKDS